MDAPGNTKCQRPSSTCAERVPPALTIPLPIRRPPSPAEGSSLGLPRFTDTSQNPPTPRLLWPTCFACISFRRTISHRTADCRLRDTQNICRPSCTVLRRQWHCFSWVLFTAAKTQNILRLYVFFRLRLPIVHFYHTNYFDAPRYRLFSPKRLPMRLAMGS